MTKLYYFNEEYSRRQYEEITKDAIKVYKEDRKPDKKRQIW